MLQKTQTDENTRATDALVGTGLTQPRSRNVREGAGHRMPWGFTYFMRRGDFIKIGHSASPPCRAGYLQVGFPDKIEVLASIPNTILSEAAAHQKFKHLLSRGEWFRAGPDLMEFIESIKPAAKQLVDTHERRHFLKILADRYEATQDERKETLALMLRRNFKAHSDNAEDRANG